MTKQARHEQARHERVGRYLADRIVALYQELGFELDIERVVLPEDADEADADLILAVIRDHLEQRRRAN